jgi:hypothetical protein
MDFSIYHMNIISLVVLLIAECRDPTGNVYISTFCM